LLRLLSSPCDDSQADQRRVLKTLEDKRGEVFAAPLALHSKHIVSVINECCQAKLSSVKSLLERFRTMDCVCTRAELDDEYVRLQPVFASLTFRQLVFP
jgi:hypothetical protein